MKIPKKALTIAGLDCSGGAGLLADVKTFQERDVYGLVANTVQVAMEPGTWAHLIHPLGLDVIREQVRTAQSIGVDAVKTGASDCGGDPCGRRDAEGIWRDQDCHRPGDGLQGCQRARLPREHPCHD